MRGGYQRQACFGPGSGGKHGREPPCGKARGGETPECGRVERTRSVKKRRWHKRLHEKRLDPQGLRFLGIYGVADLLCAPPLGVPVLHASAATLLALCAALVPLVLIQRLLDSACKSWSLNGFRRYP